MAKRLKMRLHRISVKNNEGVGPGMSHKISLIVNFELSWNLVFMLFNNIHLVRKGRRFSKR